MVVFTGWYGGGSPISAYNRSNKLQRSNKLRVQYPRGVQPGGEVPPPPGFLEAEVLKSAQPPKSLAFLGGNHNIQLRYESNKSAINPTRSDSPASETVQRRLLGGGGLHYPYDPKGRPRTGVPRWRARPPLQSVSVGTPRDGSDRGPTLGPTPLPWVGLDAALRFGRPSPIEHRGGSDCGALGCCSIGWLHPHA